MDQTVNSNDGLFSHPLLSLIGDERRFCGWGGEYGACVNSPKAPATADGWPMRWSDPANWMTYAQVQAAMQRGTVKGVGFFTTNGDHPEMIAVTVIDLDDCIADGVIVGDWQRAVVDALDTLTVVSPGGHGIHALCLGVEDFCAPEITAVKGQTVRGYECFSKAHHVRLGTMILHDRPMRKMTRDLWGSITAFLPGWLDEVAAANVPPAIVPIKPPPATPANRDRRLSPAQISYVAALFTTAHDIANILTQHGYTVDAPGHDGKRNVTRAGKTKGEGSGGNIKHGTYFPFSANDKLQANRPYTAFGAWCAFEHGGDETAAAWAADALLGLNLGQRAEGQTTATNTTAQGQAASHPGGDEPALDDAPKTKKPAKVDRPTDDALAQRWIDKQTKVAHGLGEFRRYENGFWPEVEKKVAEHELLDVICAAKGEGVKPNSGILGSVEKLASVMVSVSDTKWDNDPDLLVCKNGTLHIPTLELRDHAPGDYLTSGVPYDYDVLAECPAFLSAIRSNVPEVEEFLQEFLGLSLTTETKYEVAPWLIGPAGAGKSTLIEGFRTMLGSRVLNLGLSDIEKGRFALAKLPGKTLAISTEQPAIFIQASDVLNKIISGEPVTVERKYRDAYDITPRAKLLWAMNELPRVPDASNGLFRRIKVIRLQKLVGPVDKDLKAKIGREGAGILNYGLAGLLRLMNRGDFDIPACITNATDQFQRENDVPATFVADCCLVGEGLKTAGQQLYDAYKAWALRNGHKPQSSTTLAVDWVRLGFEKKRTMTGAVYRGVGLLVPP